jgi:dTDP-glucose 4,6-dehydratase
LSKNVLITGGAGFIAHHVIDRILATTDWNIVSLDRLDFSGNLNRLHDVVSAYPADVQKRVKIIFHDLKAEINPLIANMIGKDINYVLHLAAGSHVDRSIEFPMEFVMDNVVGTANLLQWARSLDNLDQFVYFSTDEVFGPAPNTVKYKEYDRYNSSNPYSATKAGAEELCVAFENTYKMPIIVTHTMNVFGERQHPEKFIPLCIQKVRDGESITIHSDSSRTVPGSRHYIHAKDVADGLMFILDNLQDYKHTGDYGDAKCPKFNLVGPEEVNNLQLAQMIAEAQGKELHYEMIDFHSARPGHDLRYALDGGLLKELGWEPSIRLSDRVAEVVEWTLANTRWLRK